MTHNTGWLIITLSGAGCFALKLAGYTIAPRLLARPRLGAGLELLPIALLAALIVVQSVSSGRHYNLDAARLAGVAAAAVAIWRRANFILVIVVAAGTAALLRQL